MLDVFSLIPGRAVAFIVISCLLDIAGSLFIVLYYNSSVQWHLDTTTRNALFLLEIIDTRAALSRAEELISGDRYIFIRDAYLQQREYFVNDGIVDDAFSNPDDDFDWDE